MREPSTVCLEDPQKHRKDFDDLEDAIDHINALLAPLIFTNYLQVADQDQLSAYILCILENAQSAQKALDKILPCFYGSQENSIN